jgi:hypothetical protein
VKVLRQRFTLDARSLALGRIAVATLLIADLIMRACDLEAHYSDAGVLPRSAFRVQMWDFIWSLHTLGGSSAFEGVLFALAGVCALALLVGYRTFWATLACSLLTTSLHARNPLVRDGHDDLLRIVLVFCVFLPLGARASIDRKRGRASHPFERFACAGDAVFSPATVALLLQFCIIYWVAAVAKLTSEWWVHGEGLMYALSLGRYETRLGQIALGWPRTLHVGNFLIIVGEAALPTLLLVLPRWRGRVVAAFVMFHLGFGLFLRLGMFPLASIVSWLFVLPAAFWEKLLPGSQRQGTAAPARARRLTTAFMCAGLAVVVVENLLQLRVPVPGGGIMARAASAVGLNQWWLVFAPVTKAVTAPDGWWVRVGTLPSGAQVDLDSGKPPEWRRPALISDTFANRRWRHYLANVASLNWPRTTLTLTRQAYVHWLCRQPQPRPLAEPLKHISAYFIYPVGLPQTTPLRKRLVVESDCPTPLPAADGRLVGVREP